MKTQPDDAENLSCKELVELVTEYLEGVLSAADRGRFDRHIRECTDCAAHLEQMRFTLQAAARSPTEEPLATTMGPLLAAFRQWKRSRQV